MGIEETKHDLLLKRIQITIGILAGLATLVLGIYNINKNFFSKPEPAPVPPVAATKVDPIRSALEDSAASWIRNKASKYTGSKDPSDQSKP